MLRRVLNPKNLGEVVLPLDEPLLFGPMMLAFSEATLREVSFDCLADSAQKTFKTLIELKFPRRLGGRRVGFQLDYRI
jgi:hypothetical protein